MWFYLNDSRKIKSLLWFFYARGSIFTAGLFFYCKQLIISIWNKTKYLVCFLEKTLYYYNILWYRKNHFISRLTRSKLLDFIGRAKVRSTYCRTSSLRAAKPLTPPPSLHFFWIFCIFPLFFVYNFPPPCPLNVCVTGQMLHILICTHIYTYIHVYIHILILTRMVAHLEMGTDPARVYFWSAE